MAAISDSSANVVASPAKRKWHTGMMKTWLGTNPASAPPEIEHRDPKAAQRSERRKKRKLEADKQRPSQSYRVIRGPPKRDQDAQQSPTTPPRLDMDSLIPFGDDDQESGQIAKNEPSSPDAPNVDQDVSMESPLPTSGGKDRDMAATQDDTDEPLAGPVTMQVDKDAPPASSSQPFSKEASECTEEGAGINASSKGPDATEDKSVQTAPGNATSTERPSSEPKATTSTYDSGEVRPFGPSNVPQSTKQRPPHGTRAALSPNSPLRPGDGQQAMTDVLEFNSGWRRFGPQGQKLTAYVPQFSDVPTVQWRSLLTTICPYIPHEGPLRKGKKRDKNKVKWDQAYVETVASRLEDSRARPDICKHVDFTTESDAVALIRDCMSKGVPLVFDNFPASLRWAAACDTVDSDPLMTPIAWSQHPTMGVVGVNIKTPRDFQDAAVREINNLKPYVTATLLDFKSWIKTPGKIRCILDLGCGFRQTDEITERISDNVIECLTNSFSNKYSGRFTIVSDMMKTQDWFLLHTSGFLTFGHIDASGMATSASIRGGGMKEWIIYRCKNMPVALPDSSRRERAAMQAELVDKYGDLIHAASTSTLEPPNRDDARTRDASSRRSRSVRRSESSSSACANGDSGDEKRKTVDVDGCVIELRPGMMLYQPSGTVHAAYTPVPTAAAGKHFFTYDDLHRVELSRRVQMAKKSVTNHDHNCGVQLMLIVMAAAIPARAALGQVFRRKPMIALGLMLTRPQDYIPAEKPLQRVPAAAQKKKVRAGETREEAQERWTTERDKRRDNAERQDEVDMTTRLRSPTWADDGTAFDRLAYTVATRILHHCMIAYTGDAASELPGPEYIMEGASWEDPGPEFNVEMFTDELLDVHIDDIRNVDEDLESDLTDLE